jgi:multimeric flavodoxin WrbA
MKGLAINGSARKDGNTALLVNKALAELEANGIETELVQLAGKKLIGCTACYKCFDNKDKHCAVKEDEMNAIIDKMATADGLILASPTYFADCTAGLKAVIERAGFVSRANGNMFRLKPGAAVVAVRRAGAIHAFDTINHFFTISEMITVGSIYWNVGIGRNIGDVFSDEEGMKTMAALGQNMAWLLKKING